MNLSALKLKKPLVIFDLETTGTDLSKDRIVEIAMIKVHPDGTVEKKPEARGEAHRLLINPGVPIPLETSLIHGIYDADVADRPTFDSLQKAWRSFWRGAIWAATIPTDLTFHFWQKNSCAMELTLILRAET